ncbi:MAG: cupin domain-containing protein [Rhodocyclaceae bacterium]
MDKPILNIHDATPVPRPAEFSPEGPAAEQFAVSTAPLGRLLGSKKLGYNLSAVPPGKAAYPFHNHRENEEMFFILQGTGEVRIGGNTYPIREGDVIACPPGGPETAHQIRNTGAGELRYLAVSSRLGPEICEYPDSGKFAVYAELAPDKDGKPAYFYFMGRQEMGLDYWAGEGGNPG